MSTHRFLPNNHGLDDLRREPGADASADALDALLNEIAQHDGSSRTRPGARHQRPHPRTDPDARPGTDDLSAAARAFHRRFEEEERHDPGTSALDPTLWGQIMATTASTAPSPHPFATAASPVIPPSHVIPSASEGSLRRSEPAASVPESDLSFVRRTRRRRMTSKAGMTDSRQLPSLNPAVESYVGTVVLWLSDDGSQLSLTIDGDETGTRYLIDLTDPDAAWLAVPPAPGSVEPGYGPANIFFVPGTGD